ncbi:MAG: hypothetical protein ABIE75_05275 [Candidatus Omnitrophota bacterium]
MSKVNLKKISVNKIKIFKIKNRKGYAALCLNNLTEGRTTYQAYDRMLKALKRKGLGIKTKPASLKRLLVSNI